MAEALGARIDWQADAALEGPIPEQAKQYFWQRQSMGKPLLGTPVHMPEGAMPEESEGVFPSDDAAACDFLSTLAVSCLRVTAAEHVNKVQQESQRISAESDWDNALDGLDRADLLEMGYVAGAMRDPRRYAKKP